MHETSGKPPNLFIIGAPKCGTTAFVAGLAQHPDIYVGKKEPRYFDAPVYYDDPEDYPHKCLDSYLSLYANDKAQAAQYRVDASVFNMYNPEGIKEILQMEPNAKFLLVLRDPVEAAQSMHAQRLKYTAVGMREVSDDFLMCWSLMEKRREGEGFPKNCKNRNLFRYDFLYDYGRHLDLIESLVPEEQLFVIDYEDLKREFNHTYAKVCHCLGLKNFNVQVGIVNSSFLVEMNWKNKAVYAIRNFFISLPFRPKKLAGIANKLLSKAIEEKQLKRPAKEELVEVNAYFKLSRESMKYAFEKHGIDKND